MKKLTVEEAMKEGMVLLLLPGFDCFMRGWWVGLWSYSSGGWAVRTPIMKNEKPVLITDVPRPLAIAELPNPSNYISNHEDKS